MQRHIWEDKKRVLKRLMRQFNVIKTTIIVVPNGTVFTQWAKSIENQTLL